MTVGIRKDEEEYSDHKLLDNIHFSSELVRRQPSLFIIIKFYENTWVHHIRTIARLTKKGPYKYITS